MYSVTQIHFQIVGAVALLFIGSVSANNFLQTDALATTTINQNIVENNLSFQQISTSEKLTADRFTNDNPQVVKQTRAIDWRQNGVVSPVGDQGTVCGSCWAYAAAGYIESAIAIASHQQVRPISPDHILSCSGAGSCIKGFSENAIITLARTGYWLQSSIPQTNQDVGKMQQALCGVHTIPSGRFKLEEPDQFEWVHRYEFGSLSRDQLLSEVAKRPIIANIYFPTQWANYTGTGVLNDFDSAFCTPRTTPKYNHSILIVGWIPNDGSFSSRCLGAWIIKNSHGSTWGDNGFFKLCDINETGSVQRRQFGMCNILAYIVNPVILPQ